MLPRICKELTFNNQKENKKAKKEKKLYPGSVLIISHNSMFIAQSGPISISLVAFSAQAAALPVAMSRQVLYPPNS